MKVGEKRHLVIPPNDAYGSQGAGGGKIPPNAQVRSPPSLFASLVSLFLSLSPSEGGREGGGGGERESESERE